MPGGDGAERTADGADRQVGELVGESLDHVDKVAVEQPVGNGMGHVRSKGGAGEAVKPPAGRVSGWLAAQPSLGCPRQRDVCPAVSGYGRGRTRCHLCSRSRVPSAAAHLRQTICTASAAPPVAGCASLHEIPPNRRSWLRLNASPQTVWLVPGSQPCTSPAGRRCPSGSRHSSVAATRARTALTPHTPATPRTCTNPCPRQRVGTPTPTPRSAPAPRADTISAPAGQRTAKTFPRKRLFLLLRNEKLSYLHGWLMAWTRPPSPRHRPSRGRPSGRASGSRPTSSSSPRS